jgi:nucleoside-diphosphate-sugar epimerase
MNIRGKNFLVVGSAGLIGSHTIDALLREEVRDAISLPMSAESQPADQKNHRFVDRGSTAVAV